MTCRTAFAALLKLMLLASIFAVIGGVASLKAAAQTIQSQAPSQDASPTHLVDRFRG